jgi:cephalosporin-C deacetylase
MTDFDSTYGYNLERLLQVGAPQEPPDFAEFWRYRYQRAVTVNPMPRLDRYESGRSDFDCFDLTYRSTDNIEIKGWALMPKQRPVRRGVIVGHGYGGREGPDFHLPIADAAFLFPCFRGLARSRCPPISDNPAYHVLHDINNKDRYILGGCVEDLWLCVSALLSLFPGVAGHVAYLGISFGGGVGAMALPWDSRIQKAHFNVPSFGNQPLRLQLPTWGSAASVQNYRRSHGHVLDTLNYYDAACAARYLRIPVHVAAALSDPVVAPPGQFSIYNALAGEKKLFILEQGHADYFNKASQEQTLLAGLNEFFKAL